MEDSAWHSGQPLGPSLCVFPQLRPKPDPGPPHLTLMGLLQVSGVAFFSVETAEHLLATHVSPPLDACTYMGLDSGARPVQVTAGGGWGPWPGGGAQHWLCDLRLAPSPLRDRVSGDGAAPVWPRTAPE